MTRPDTKAPQLTMTTTPETTQTQAAPGLTSTAGLLMLTTDERAPYLAALLQTQRHDLARTCLTQAGRALDQAGVRRYRGRAVHARLLTARAHEAAALAAELLEH